MTLRDLNRATLARQMLLARGRMPVARAVERLLGIQAQLPRPPFAGLWSRLDGFTGGDLVKALTTKAVVRATAMRGTIHLMTARDFVAFRACLQPSLDAGVQSILKERARSMDAARVLAAARSFLESPHNFEEVRDHLASRFPAGDARAMGYTARLGVPLVQVPADARWGFPAQADFVSAEAWLGKPMAACRSADAIVSRYLAAYGPSTVKDAQAWLGMGGLDEVFARLGATLVTIEGPAGRTWFDLPDAPRPGPDAPAPVRFLPEWDGVVVTRADERVVARADRPKVFLPGLRVAAVVLVDGFAAGTWKIAATAKKATLTVEPFRKWAAPVHRQVEAEGEALLRFTEPAVSVHDVTVTAP